MEILVIGTGGREHALVRSLSRDETVAVVHVAPGNPGMDPPAVRHQVDPLDADAVADLAGSLGADLVVIGPEAPLVAGVADVVRERGIACFGPSAAAARLEGSKAFAKEVMAAAEVPTARAHVAENPAEVDAALDAFGPPYVVKDDALAAGKGVLVTDDPEAARAHAAACGRVVVEEYLDGPEVSLFAITDGENVVPLVPAQDFKRVGEGDVGANTGGMGAYAPLAASVAAPTDELVAEVARRVLVPTVQEMARRGTPFQGLLYAGLALTGRGVRVVEFNARFGDPETQCVLALLRSPLAPLLHAAATGRLDTAGLPQWHDGAAVTVVLAAEGYPASPRTGDPVDGVEVAAALDGVDVLHAGTRLDDAGRLVSAGGRVLGVTARGEDLPRARERAYAGVEAISLDGSHYRRDIAAAASGVTP